MAVSETEQMLSEAAAEVLETMFFASLAEEGVPTPPLTEPCVCTRLAFHGDRSGCVGARVPLETAREIAANFLGLDGQGLTDARVYDVICELTNMVCGLLLGRLESGSLFELSRAELGSPEAGCPPGKDAVCRTLALEGGVMEVWLEWGRP